MDVHVHFSNPGHDHRKGMEGKIAYQTDGISERECGESLIVIDSSIAVNNQKNGYKIGKGGFQSGIPLFFLCVRILGKSRERKPDKWIACPVSNVTYSTWSTKY
ncbi:hypothetical protein QRD90_05265 [Peribacillus frigoritolerans]|uniref:hypothetical protein n=1 Tax=Peribacillus frigoritolerans TaxID=450367 RepID=UPI002079909E|nr:hypothetical protein [Peribacillus frigoritolerans]USK81351.1 hypothetical protein LHV56_05260 [Peribacillus frigoritolerans]WJE48631.1 hypothetical protein QRD90_05265 [Peribacillus frigoritolerans]